MSSVHNNRRCTAGPIAGSSSLSHKGSRQLRLAASPPDQAFGRKCHAELRVGRHLVRYHSAAGGRSPSGLPSRTHHADPRLFRPSRPSIPPSLPPLLSLSLQDWPDFFLTRRLKARLHEDEEKDYFFCSDVKVVSKHVSIWTEPLLQYLYSCRVQLRLQAQRQVQLHTMKCILLTALHFHIFWRLLCMNAVLIFLETDQKMVGLKKTKKTTYFM